MNVTLKLLLDGNEIINVSVRNKCGDSVGTVVKVLFYKSEGCWFDS